MNFGLMVALRLQKYVNIRKGLQFDHDAMRMPRWVKILPFVCSGK